MSEQITICATCGGPVLDDYAPGVDHYGDTAGGHADRHTLIVEAAERAVTTEVSS